jgi:hypothetical protein
LHIYFCDGGGNRIYHRTLVIFPVVWKIEGMEKRKRRGEETHKITARKIRPMKSRIPAKTQRPQRYHAEWQLP